MRSNYLIYVELIEHWAWRQRFREELADKQINVLMKLCQIWCMAFTFHVLQRTICTLKIGVCWLCNIRRMRSIIRCRRIWTSNSGSSLTQCVSGIWKIMCTLDGWTQFPTNMHYASRWEVLCVAREAFSIVELVQQILGFPTKFTSGVQF